MQNKGDGKLVEVGSGGGQDLLSEEKIDSLQLEVSWWRWGGPDLLREEKSLWVGSEIAVPLMHAPMQAAVWCLLYVMLCAVFVSAEQSARITAALL